MIKRTWHYIVAVVIIGIIIVLPWWFCGSTTTQVLLIRHADRADTQDALSPAGLIRRQELVHVAEKAQLSAIIRSNTVRAEQTAALLATATGITPIVIAANDIQAVVDNIRNNHRGGRVLVVGHSNTVPQVIAGLGGPTIANIDDGEFDNLFTLNLCRCRWFTAPLVNLQYGAPSP